VFFGTLVQPLVILSAGLLVAYILSGLFQALQTWAIEVVQRRLFVRVAGDFARRLTNLRAESLDGIHGPELVNRFLEVVTVQKKTSELMLYAVNTVLASALGMVVLSLFHPALLGFVAILLVLLFVVVVVLGRRAVRTAVEESMAKFEVLAWLENLISEETTFVTRTGGLFALERTNDLCERYLHRRSGHFRILFTQTIGSLFLQAFAATAMLAVGGWLVINQTLTPGQLVASELIVSGIAANIGKLGPMLASWYDVCAAADKLYVVLGLPQERQGGEDNPPGAASHQIELKRVSYAYAGQQPLLKDLDLDIAAGEHVAIEGLHGAGVSTLLELIAGRRTPTTGYITYGGVDLRQLHLRGLRESVVLVRDPEIFAGTVLENLRLGREDLDLASVRTSLELVELWEPLMALPQGLETRLDTGAPSLASSEALRLTLARALLHQPRVLLLDKALDGIDHDLRERVTEALLSPERGWTVLIASEYRATLERCPRKIELPAPRFARAITETSADTNRPS
jgi:ABC-type bacteriocin/lantibiotic exporter with double-glycine peptidase domain